jgi:hypothetical protein
MSVHEIEAAIIRLTPQQLLDLLAWLQDYYDKTGEQVLEEESELDHFDAEIREGTTLYAAAD